MDGFALFAQNDPWSHWALRRLTVPYLEAAAPSLAVLFLGMIAAVAFRRRFPAVARRVFLGCALLTLSHVLISVDYWLWAMAFPDPVRPQRAVAAYHDVFFWI